MFALVILLTACDPADDDGSGWCEVAHREGCANDCGWFDSVICSTEENIVAECEPKSGDPELWSCRARAAETCDDEMMAECLAESK